MAFWPKQSLLVWIESIYKILEFGPLLTKVRHNLAHLELQEKAHISIQRLLLPLLSSLRAFSYSALFHRPPSPTALSFIRAQHLFLFSAFSYHSYLHCEPFPIALYFTTRILLQRCLNVISECISKPRILVWPSQLQVVWGRGSTSPPPQPQPLSPPLTLPLTSLSVTLPASGVGTWSPLPLTPISPPKTVGQPRSLCMGDENCGGGEGGKKSIPALSKWQFIQKHRGGGYKHTCLVTRLLLLRLLSFRAFSYGAYLYPMPSPTMLNFAKPLLLWCLVASRAFSYCAYLHSTHSPMAVKEWKKMQVWKDPVKEKGQ